MSQFEGLDAVDLVLEGVTLIATPCVCSWRASAAVRGRAIDSAIVCPSDTCNGGVAGAGLRGMTLAVESSQLRSRSSIASCCRSALVASYPLSMPSSLNFRALDFRGDFRFEVSLIGA
jgi:hypothetical protein